MITDEEIVSVRGTGKTRARIEEDKEEKPKGGRPPHEPNEAFRGAVTMLVAFRIPIYRIAQAMKIAESTLRIHYAHEIENAETIVDSAVLTAWMKNVQRGKEMTILRYMEQKYRLNNHDGVAAALPSVIVIDNIPRENDGLLENNVPDQR